MIVLTTSPWTVQAYLTTDGQHVERLQYVDEYIRRNAAVWVAAVNPLMAEFGHPRSLTSGFRDRTSNANCGGALYSWHCRALAGDIDDQGRALDKFCTEAILEKYHLWAEHRDDKKRVHLQTEAPRLWKTGMSRRFYP